ncbi:MAG: hypothetical protein A2X94_07420 [Bdellovibrionales bacterium GWB1_55_8]|nr:MAG: hypothetical protein A2X94_07420 [Bdellovibrionales bacterium GWB1_55_8]
MVFFVPPHQRRLAMLAAQADNAPALIYGASGTGKSAIARWIHSNGPRAGGVLRETSDGTQLNEQIPLAQGGTLVLHEVGRFTLSQQMILLEFLKTKSISASGRDGVRMIVNARVVATTSQALEGRAQGGLFNEELLQKLNVFRIEMPPLAKRAEEFEDISLGILGELSREFHKEHLRGFTAEAWEALRGYDWPGNIRELRNVLRLAVSAANGDHIEVRELPDFGHNRMDFRSTREQFEKVYILELLRTFDWEIDRTCEMSRMDKTTLLEKIRLYGLRPIEKETRPAPV